MRAQALERLLPLGRVQIARLDEAFTAVGDALVLVGKTDERWWEAELHRLRNDFLWRFPNADAIEVEACFQKAIGVARRQEAKLLELRATVSLSRLWQRLERRADAYEQLAAVYGWFTEGFDSPDLQEAKALLRELVDGS